MRIDLTPAYVLHARPYRETSLLLEVFAREHGRCGLVARGARRQRSPTRSALQPFRPLLVSWTGRAELMNLTGVESPPGASVLGGRRLLAGLYLNELLVRLLPRADPQSDLFDAYAAALGGLADASGDEETLLREFEKRLLQALGYGMVLDGHDVGGSPLDPGALYRYEVERGAAPVGLEGGRGVVVHGATLLGLAAGTPLGPDARQEAKRLMRVVLGHYLGDRPLKSRELFRGLSAPSGGGPGGDAAPPPRGGACASPGGEGLSGLRFG